MSSALATNLDDHFSKAIGRALLDPETTIVIGQFRADQWMRLDQILGKSPSRTMYLATYHLQPFFCLESVKGNSTLPEVVFVEVPLGSTSTDRRDPFYVVEAFPDDAVRILCVRPLQKFRQPPQTRITPEFWKVSEEEAAKLAPAELFEKFGLGSQINSQTLFSIHPDGAARRLEFDAPAKNSIQEPNSDDQRRIERIRQAGKTLPQTAAIEAAFYEDIKLLSKILPNSGTKDIESAKARFRALITPDTRATLARQLKTPLGHKVLQAMAEESESEN